MKINDAIKLAIENGLDKEMAQECLNTGTELCLLLKPEFWQALGKGMVWNKAGTEDEKIYERDITIIKPRGSKSWFQGIPEGTFVYGEGREYGYIERHKMNECEFRWHSLIDHLASGGTIESFFEQLK